MKKYIIILLAFTACQSEPVQEKEAVLTSTENTPVWDGITTPKIEWSGRSGSLQPLWYKESMTTDNYVLFPNQPQTQRAYNKLMIDSVFMTRVGTEIVNVNYVNCGFYNVSVKFKGDTISTQGTYLSALGPNVINYIPYGAHVLHSSNKYRITQLIKTTDKILFPGWEMGRMKWKYKYVVMVDSDTLGIDYITPNHPVGSAYGMAHK